MPISMPNCESWAKTKTDPEREHRISMEIIVDAYNEYEQALGWYYYLKEQLQFPFTATCVCKRAISPLQVKDEVEVPGDIKSADFNA